MTPQPTTCAECRNADLASVSSEYGVELCPLHALTDELAKAIIEVGKNLRVKA